MHDDDDVSYPLHQQKHTCLQHTTYTCNRCTTLPIQQPGALPCPYNSQVHYPAHTTARQPAQQPPLTSCFTGTAFPVTMKTCM